MLRIIDQVFVNKYGQGIINIDSFKSLFSNFYIEEKRNYLEGIVVLIVQSKPNNNDIEPAIKESKLKSTYTPCILLKKGIETYKLKKIVYLPDNELEKSLILLLALFKITYQRRFNKEKNDPNKWWYWDLSNPILEAKIQEKFL